ncbi:4-hydroxythreonine-4-phosphate dehydrogenase PdxA [Parvularcula maris]|uniref:4-hydroxythreonine-4-phosphate dehydrogenase n=1 Tax=Parvularcula maris TaxID=2965077 RepID=A0A9X2LB97_9PROT|nr:4-hydroxythreonine-4-phosphate dehydrogenase PdxA [Parvularcula maris]MCQ8186550.1 4-hydroxythreonine-4-phosphate dehydrogenase PdxA [Parvularcula maris]
MAVRGGLPLAVSMGEPAGIGTEILFKIYEALRTPDRQGPAFFLIDDPARVAKLARSASLPFQITTITAPAEAASAFKEGLPVLQVAGHGLTALMDAEPGKPSAATAPFVIASIGQAVRHTMKGEAGAVVTLPIQKSVLQEADFPHPGHTEYLEALGREYLPAEEAANARAVMMLAAGSFRTVPATVHQPLSQVPAALSTEKIVAKAQVLAADLQSRLGVARPRIAVSGLNPHAGEDGHLGTEEKDVIVPAIEALRAQGIDAFGPFPADTMFHEEARRAYDAALCMYHDQALIPIKTLAFHDAVNVTLGLPFIRTSPDHGTGLDIAGKGVARPDSTFAAMRMAAQMAAIEQRQQTS